MRNSQFVRLLIVVFLILILQIPTVMLQKVVSDRQSLRQEAISNITSKWGTKQMVIGPRLVVPYTKQEPVSTGLPPLQSNGLPPGQTNAVQTQTKSAAFLPEELQIDSVMTTEVRYRGIFEVPVYQTKLALKGQFQRPDFSALGVQPEDVRWDKANLILQISDAHAIQNQPILTWNQKALPFAPGNNTSEIYVNLAGQMTGNTFNFAIPITLNGSEQLKFAPFGKVTKVTMKANWNNPSFEGLWLPTDRSISAKDFTASWNIPFLGRNYPQLWTSDNPVSPTTIEQSLFGVDLISPVDHYRMAERSIKYNFLFLILTFAVFWLFEVTVQLRVHPVQYLLVGVALSMFYLLQLAISEHLGFQTAYWIATAATVTLLTAYSVAVLQANRRGITVGIMQVALYAYLYVVLANQDYSLLMGSIGLFVFLAIVMYFTRRIDWFAGDRGRIV